MSQPTCSSATGYVGEQFFTLDFDVALDAAHPPPINAFNFQINGDPRVVTDVAVDSVAKTVQVTFSGPALGSGAIIEFSYLDPTGGNDINAIQGTDGTDAATFTPDPITVTDVRTGPPAPPMPGLSTGSDSGTLGDGITSDDTPTLTGTAGANNSITLYDSDATVLGTTTADGSGNWSITSSTLSEDSHNLRVDQTDSGHNISPKSTGLVVTVDTHVDAPSSLAIAAGSDSGSLGDGITNTGMPVITGHAEAGAAVRLYDTGGTTQVGSAMADGSGNFSITSSSVLSEGLHTLTVKQTDTAGNVSAASDDFTYRRDTVGPVGMDLDTTTVQMSSATNGATVATLSATDDTAVTYGFAVGNGNTDADNDKFIISGTSLVAADNLTAGTYHFFLKATDAAGNDAFKMFALDVVDGPQVTSIVRADGAPEAVAASAASVTYTVTFTQAVTGVDIGDFTLTATGGAGGTISSATGSGDTYTVIVDNPTGDGTLRLDLKASGTGIQNGSAQAILGGYAAGSSYSLDHTAPAVPGTPVQAVGTDTGASDSDGITSATTLTFTGTETAAAGVTITLYDTDGTVLGQDTDGTGNWSITSPLTEGAHTITARASDAAGNESEASTTTVVTVDRTAPAFTAAAVNGNSLVMSFADTGSKLDAGHTADASAFTVLVDGTADGVIGAVVDAAARTVTLTLTTAAAPGQVVKVAYADTPGDGTDTLQDPAGNDAASVLETTVTNNTPAPPSEPAPGVTATAPAAGGTVQGSAGNDTLAGQGGSDIFVLGGGGDAVNGGGGIDTVVENGSRASYTITHTADGTFTLRGADGSVATLQGVERVQFGDVTVALDPTTTSGRIAELYKMALGRDPEDGGLSYQADISSEVSTAQLVTGFITSPEYARVYGQLGDGDFITQVYANAFGRAPDAGGMAFYLDVLSHSTGLDGRVAMLAGFLDSPEMAVKLVGLIDQGVPLLAG